MLRILATIFVTWIWTIIIGRSIALGPVFYIWRPENGAYTWYNMSAIHCKIPKIQWLSHVVATTTLIQMTYLFNTQTILSHALFQLWYPLFMVPHGHKYKSIIFIILATTLQLLNSPKYITIIILFIQIWCFLLHLQILYITPTYQPENNPRQKRETTTTTTNSNDLIQSTKN